MVCLTLSKYINIIKGMGLLAAIVGIIAGMIILWIALHKDVKSSCTLEWLILPVIIGLVGMLLIAIVLLLGHSCAWTGGLGFYDFPIMPYLCLLPSRSYYAHHGGYLQ